MDVAIVKATNHVECPPKERHLRSIVIFVLDPFFFVLIRFWVLEFSGQYCEKFEFLDAEILIATSAIRPRADVAYCIRALSRRLAKTHNWTVRWNLSLPY